MWAPFALASLHSERRLLRAFRPSKSGMCVTLRVGDVTNDDTDACEATVREGSSLREILLQRLQYTYIKQRQP